MILQCSCEHEFQDERYGKGNRVHTWAEKAKDAGTTGGWRCTVCGSVKAPNTATKKSNKK